MRSPAHLTVTLRRSRIATCWLASLAVLAAVLLAIMPAPAWLDVGGALVVAAWAVHRIRLHGTRRSPRSIVELSLSEDRWIAMRDGAGEVSAGVVLDSSHVHPWFTSIVWRPAGARFARSLPIAPDMLDADDFRRLRVLLRYGRRADSAGAPASQA
jgi:toxin CptA